MEIFSSIEGIDEPQISSDNVDAYFDECEKYTKKVCNWCKEVGNHKLSGEIVRFPFADGYAKYVVLTKDKLVHLNTSDGYHYPHIEHLPFSVIEKQIKGQKALKKLFS